MRAVDVAWTLVSAVDVVAALHCDSQGADWQVVGPVEHRRRGLSRLRPSLSSTSSRDAEEFVHVRPTILSLARLLAKRFPVVVKALTWQRRVLLWVWFCLMVLGELAATIWWLHSLEGPDLLILAAPFGLVISLALVVLSAEQVLSSSGALLLAVMPALPAYSAVLLMIPFFSADVAPAEQTWEMFHWLTLSLLNAFYIPAAVLVVLRAEYPKPSRCLSTAMTVLDVFKRHARRGSIAAACLYALAVAHADLHSTGPLASSRGRALALHLLGLFCANLRRQTQKALGAKLVPWLLGERCARSLSLRVLATNHGHQAWRSLPSIPALRRSVPPTPVAALVVTARRTAPVVIPILAAAPQCARSGSLLFPCCCLALAAAVAAAIIQEMSALPRSPLQRLPFLLPSLTPRARFCVGHLLVAADSVAGAREGIVSLASTWRGTM